jgi:uncharacterized membrane protein
LQQVIWLLVAVVAVVATAVAVAEQAVCYKAL